MTLKNKIIVGTMLVATFASLSSFQSRLNAQQTGPLKNVKTEQTDSLKSGSKSDTAAKSPASTQSAAYRGLGFFPAFSSETKASSAELAPDLKSRRELAKNIRSIVTEDVSFILMSEPALAALPEKSLHKLLGILLSGRIGENASVPFMPLEVPRLMYGLSDQVMRDSNGQPMLQDRAEFQNALSRVYGALLFRWGINRPVLIGSFDGAITLIVDCSEPLPNMNQLVESAWNNMTVREQKEMLNRK